MKKQFPLILAALTLLLGLETQALLILRKDNFASAILRRVAGIHLVALGDVADARSYWADHIDAFGPERAYQELKTIYAAETFGAQHRAAHLFGELLYEKTGVAGFATCDESFSFGCFHSFLTAAVAREGIGIVNKLDAACVEKFGTLGTGCQHGIGHGILEYLGHASENLVRALDACAQTTQIRKLLGCSSGVFMEYNFPTVIAQGEASAKTRTFQPDNPSTPCNTVVPKQFRESCYYELAAWWQRATDDIGRLGQWCYAVAAAADREACFLGIGNSVTFSENYRLADTLARCAQMPDAEGILLCRAGAAWALFAEPQKRNLAAAPCEVPDAQDQKRCLIKANLAAEGVPLSSLR